MAKDFPEYTFAIADEEDYATEVKDLGLSESGEDVNAAILDEGGKKFAMEPEEFDSDVLREFVTAFKKGQLLSSACLTGGLAPRGQAAWPWHSSHEPGRLRPSHVHTHFPPGSLNLKPRR